MPYTAGPFSSQHLYLQWGGKLPGNEQWSCGLRMLRTGGGAWPPEGVASVLTPVKTAIQAFHVRVGSMISARALLSFVKLNMVDEDGTYTLDTTNQAVIADVAGGGTDYGHPNQVTIAVSTETGFSRGPAHRGRFYLPLPGMAVEADGLISVADATAIKTSSATLLTALNAASTLYKVGVMSRKSGAPAERPVTGFSVGRVLDTQRRRRRSLLETRV